MNRPNVYRLLVPTGVTLIIGPMLAAAKGYTIGDLALIAVGLLPAFEGLLLAANYDDQTAGIVRRLRTEQNPSVLSSVPTVIWRLCGICIAFIGVLLIVVGIGHIVR